MRYTDNDGRAYRVMIEKTWNENSSDPGRVTVTYYGPYSTKAAAKGIATRENVTNWHSWSITGIEIQELQGEWQEVSD
jgi:hypothetical protein